MHFNSKKKVFPSKKKL